MLRDFLLDGTLNKVGRSLGRHPRFMVPTRKGDLGTTKGVVVQYAAHAMDSRWALPGVERDLLPMDRFLAHPMITLDDETYSVKLIVRVAANAMGPGHFGAPKDPAERRLFDRATPFAIEDDLHDGVGLIESATRTIIQATREACEPLRKMAVARTSL